MFHMYKSLLLLLLTWADLQAANAFPHHRHHHGGQKRDAGQCTFPYAEKMVAVTPEKGNAGWAMSPNQYCTSDSWCPYACEPGYVMAQWSPHAKSYSYPESMHGGLYCDSNGNAVKPFDDKEYCYPGVGNVFAIDETGKGVSFCQTVLPGNEAMLIPTWVSAGSEQVLAVPDASYWVGTAAHYYVNPPGFSTSESCIWGTSDKPYGNWAPYVVGANMDENNITYVKLGANPIYLDDPYWSTIKPRFGLKVECEGNTCSGLPCYMDPREKGVQGCPDGSPNGAGDACFCVVGFQPGTKARIVVVDYSDQMSSSSAMSSGTAAPTASATSTAEMTSSSLTNSSAFALPSGFSSSILTLNTQTNSQSSSSFSLPAPKSTANPSTTGSEISGYHKASSEISSDRSLSFTNFVTVNTVSRGKNQLTGQDSQSTAPENKPVASNTVVTGSSTFKSSQPDPRNSGWSSSTNVPVVPIMTTGTGESKNGSSNNSNNKGKYGSESKFSPTSAKANIFLTTVTSYSNAASPFVHTINGQETTTTTTVAVQNMHAEIQTAFHTLVVSDVVHDTATQYI
ncbi:ceell wall beta-glucosidase Adg3 [Schizosaccharomyces osmophilus]|uniref:Ceell wall beta-glucosidase Adg3 n=1 Tax=Schizosaccharomyces osmophilus TaxID=2545709 RepID=A0AAF0AXR4_9SCHI|nr:ceell wall beta-glucosidase Adg3 [Schizosaccharomyces osmophilus]WBW75017.1 ceell wall beta-glucosidase Adg3 [Schizosaccharomyces osmophilus]